MGLEQGSFSVSSADLDGAHLQALWDRAPVGIARVSLQGRWLDLNQRACATLGRERQELVSVSWTDFLHPADAAGHSEQARRLSAGEIDGFCLEQRRFRRDGSIVWTEIHATLVPHDAGQACFIAILQDVSQRKELEDRRERLIEIERQARTAAEGENQQKDAFLAMLSHELRTPLTPVLLSAGTMEQDASLPVHVRVELGMMRRNIEVQARLVDDLLDLTRLGRGKLDLRLCCVDIHQVIEHALQITRPDISAKRLSLQSHLGASWPHVKGDPDRLLQVLWNLLKNAIKFTPDAGEIRLETRNTPEHRLEIKVQDNGMGIEPEALGRIFAAYEQASQGVTRRYGGLGLGLTISRSLVELHGGILQAHSDGAGHGAVFTVILPCSTTTAQADEAQSLSRITTRSSGALRILLVEDHHATSRLVARLLADIGHWVQATASVAEARSAIAAGRYDLLICDVDLPDGSGLEVVRAMHARNSAVPAIAVSGFGAQQDLLHSFTAGCAAHLTKPLKFDKLLRTIHEVVRPVPPPRRSNHPAPEGASPPAGA